MSTVAGKGQILPMNIPLTSQYLTKLLGPLAHLDLPTSIVPGQPLSLTWELDVYLGAPGDQMLQGLTAKIYLNCDVLYVSPQPVQITTSLYGFKTSGPQEVTIPPPADPAIAKRLYSFGTKILRLEVTDSGGKGLFADQNTVDVVAENSDASWWNWELMGVAPSDDPQGYSAWFGQPYQVAGTFTNRSQWSGRHGTLRILELYSFDYSANPPFIEPPVGTERASTAFDLPPGATQQLGSVAIVNTWSWLSLSGGAFGFGSTVPWISQTPTSFGPNPKIYGLSNDTTFHEYDYLVLASLEDDYGNQYPEAIYPTTYMALNDWLHSQPAIEVIVAIPESKLQLAETASNLLSYAQWFMYFSWLIPAADRIAEHLTETAEGYVLAANDPPNPDPRYREPVTMSGNQMPEFMAGDLQLSVLDQGIALIGHILEAWQAQNIIQGRLEGARLANDKGALQLQAESYIATVNHLVDAASRLLRLTTAMVDAIEKDGRFDWQAYQGLVECWLVQGIPQDIINRWQDKSLSLMRLRQLEVAVKNPAIARRSPFVGSILEATAQALARLAYSIREETWKLFSTAPTRKGQ